MCHRTRDDSPTTTALGLHSSLQFMKHARLGPIEDTCWFRRTLRALCLPTHPGAHRGEGRKVCPPRSQGARHGQHGARQRARGGDQDRRAGGGQLQRASESKVSTAPGQGLLPGVRPRGWRRAVEEFITHSHRQLSWDLMCPISRELRELGGWRGCYLPMGSKTQVLIQRDLRFRADHRPVAHRR